jgi:hypothetical protein
VGGQGGVGNVEADVREEFAARAQAGSSSMWLS